MLNKFLCWMWGCQFNKRAIKSYTTDNGHARYFRFGWLTCIHCGARKHD